MKQYFSFSIMCSLFLLSHAIAVAQLLLPYRKGTQWGLCDTNGKVKLTPAYDEVLYGKQTPSEMPGDFFVVKKDSLFGVVNGKKEIIPPLYEKILALKFSFFIALGKDKYDLKTFQLDGSPLLPEGVTYKDILWSSLDGRRMTVQARPDLEKIFLLEVRMGNKLKGIYLYFPQQPQKSRLLFTGCKYIRYKPHSELQAISFYPEQCNGQTESVVTYGLNKSTKNFEIISLPKQEKQVGEVSDDRYGTGMIDLDDVVAVPDDLTIEKRSVPEAKSIRFIIRDDSVFAVNILEQKKHFTQKLITGYLSQLKSCNSFNAIAYNGAIPRFTSGDTSIYFYNYLQYKNAAGKNYMLTNYNSAPIQLDSVAAFNSFNSAGNYFVGGNVQPDGTLLFGVRNVYDSVILPMLYQEIMLKDALNSPIYSDGIQVVVKQQNLYGIQSINNKTILPCRYDSILNIKTSNAYTNYRLLEKDKKYGIYFTGINHQPTTLLIEPFTHFRPTEIIWLRPQQATQKMPGSLIIKLRDANGKLIGYTNSKGKKFWVD